MQNILVRLCLVVLYKVIHKYKNQLLQTHTNINPQKETLVTLRCSVKI